MSYLLLIIYLSFPVFVWIADGADTKELKRCRGGIAVWYAPAVVFIYSLLVFTESSTAIASQ
jgi:hypothetical protein